MCIFFGRKIKGRKIKKKCLFRRRKRKRKRNSVGLYLTQSHAVADGRQRDAFTIAKTGHLHLANADALKRGTQARNVISNNELRGESE